MRNLTIKEWASEDRPREKFLSKGIVTLTDAELIAILLSTGTKKLSAVALAKHILSTVNNNIDLLGKQTVTDLIKIEGIGQAKAITIIAALELGKRRKKAYLERVEVTDSKIVFDIFQPILGDLPHEEFWVLFLNRANTVISKERISVGGVTGTVTDIKIILKQAIEKLAEGIILIHNHPSGNANPSKSDADITEKIKQAALLLDVKVLDHIIITSTKYFSFNDHGRL